MVALDRDHQLVRGGARLTIADLARLAVDVELTPDGHAVLTWDALPVTDGGFAARASATDSIRGAFYGPAAEEVGGVFERNQLLGAFGAARQPAVGDGFEAMTCVRHKPGVAAAPPHTVPAPAGLCPPGEEPAAYSSVVPISETHDSQACLAMRVISRAFRSTGEMEGGEG